MVLGPAGAGAPCWAAPCAFPTGRSGTSSAFTTNRWYRQMSLLIAMPQTLSGEPQVVLPDAAAGI